jgi:hypothetical protein
MNDLQALGILLGLICFFLWIPFVYTMASIEEYIQKRRQK